MSGLAWATWAAIVILVVGSSAIFVWFLFDAKELLRGPGGDDESGEAERRRR